jgi:hypothetical protein
VIEKRCSEVRGVVRVVFVIQDKWTLLPGEYSVAIGGASDDLPMKAKVRLGE